MTEPAEKSAPGSAAARQSWRRLSSDERRAQLMAIAERHYIMEKGQTAWHGTSAELQRMPELKSRYLGIE